MAKRINVARFFDEIDPDTFRVLLNNVKPSNQLLEIEIPDITSWKFCDVMQVIGEADKATPFELCSMVLNLFGETDEQNILKANSNEFMRFMKHVKNEIEKIGKLQEQLHSDPKADLVNAGVDRLNIFGPAMIYYAISTDPGEWNRISEIEYSKIYTKLMIDKVQSEIQEAFNQIQIDKQKQRK